VGVLLSLTGVHHGCRTEGQVAEVTEDVLGCRGTRAIGGMLLEWNEGSVETGYLHLMLNIFLSADASINLILVEEKVECGLLMLTGLLMCQVERGYRTAEGSAGFCQGLRGGWGRV